MTPKFPNLETKRRALFQWLSRQHQLFRHPEGRVLPNRAYPRSSDYGRLLRTAAAMQRYKSENLHTEFTLDLSTALSRRIVAAKLQLRRIITSCYDTVTATCLLLEQPAIADLEEPTHLSDQSRLLESGQ